MQDDFLASFEQNGKVLATNTTPFPSSAFVVSVRENEQAAKTPHRVPIVETKRQVLGVDRPNAHCFSSKHSDSPVNCFRENQKPDVATCQVGNLGFTSAVCWHGNVGCAIGLCGKYFTGRGNYCMTLVLLSISCLTFRVFTLLMKVLPMCRSVLLPALCYRQGLQVLSIFKDACGDFRIITLITVYYGHQQHSLVAVCNLAQYKLSCTAD